MNKQDFDRMYDKYHRLVLAAAKTVIDDESFCEDVCQEVFVKLYKSGLDIDAEQLRYWLLRVTRNTALDFRRTMKIDKIKLEALEEHEEKHVSVEDPLQQIVTKEKATEMMDALWEHDPRGMEILIGIEIMGCSVQELAAHYDITPNNVRNRLYRAKKWMVEKYPDMKGYF